jgi:hypothetical protein
MNHRENMPRSGAERNGTSKPTPAEEIAAAVRSLEAALERRKAQERALASEEAPSGSDEKTEPLSVEAARAGRSYSLNDEGDVVVPDDLTDGKYYAHRKEGPTAYKRSGRSRAA